VRRVALATVCCYLLSAGAAAALDAPDVERRIVPGQSIGKVRLGMTLAQVKRGLGPPESVIVREQRPFGGEWIEYSWNLTEWRIGFAIDDGVQRVTSIRSRARTERTREGIGPGVAGARVPRTYRVSCVDAFLPDRQSPQPGIEPPSVGFWCVVPQRGGARTAFVVGSRCAKTPERYRPCERWVTEVAEAVVLAAGEPLPVTLRRNRVWEP
jgi:hypothetical protein